MSSKIICDVCAKEIEVRNGEFDDLIIKAFDELLNVEIEDVCTECHDGLVIKMRNTIQDFDNEI